MKAKKKYHKWIGLVLVLVIAIVGASQMKIQSVSNYKKQQVALEKNLGMTLVSENTSQSGITTKGSIDGKKHTKQFKGSSSKKTQGLFGKIASVLNGGDHKKKKDTSKKNQVAQTTKKTTHTKNSETAKPTASTKDSGKANSATPDTGTGTDSVTATPSPTSYNVVTDTSLTPEPTILQTAKPAEDKITCTIQIRCDSLVTNKASVADNYEKYIPSDGVILEEVEVSVAKGSSVYDVLSSVCKAKDIPLDAQYSKTFGTNYVQGIGYLYEKIAGDMSGWIYKVDGVSPNKGASSYTVTQGNKILWFYTCNGRN